MTQPAHIDSPAAAAAAPAELSTRERILRAATALFARHGYEGTSLRMIADATGMQKGSVVYHFETKASIREAVLASILSRWNDVLPQLMLTASTGKNRFERTVNECTRFFREDPNRAKFLMQESVSRPAELSTELAVQVAPWLELIGERIRQGQAEGRIYPDVDPPVYVWSVVIQIIGAIATLPLVAGVLTDGELIERVEVEIVRICRRSLFMDRPRATTS